MAKAAPTTSVTPESGQPEDPTAPIKKRGKSNSIPGDFPESFIAEENPSSDHHVEPSKPWLIAYQQGTLGSRNAKPFEVGFYSKAQYDADAVLLLAFAQIRESRKNQPVRPEESYLKLLVPQDAKVAKALVSTWSKKK